MSILIRKEVKINRTVTISSEQARAIEDKARFEMLQLLYHRELSADQISTELNKSGFKKAVTTIRHHLDILKNAGLVEVVKMEESRGAVIKFYSTSVKILKFHDQPQFDLAYSKTISEVTNKIEKIMQSILNKNQKKINRNLEGQSEQNHYQFILVEIINRAITNIFENKKNIEFITQKKLKPENS